MRTLGGYTLVFCLLASLANAQMPEASRVKGHIKILANDSLQGRGTGTDGERMAAAYIQAQFNALNLKPRGDQSSFLQVFDFKSGTHGTGAAGKANNVVAFLDNGSENTIVIGAHYDHLGLGNDGSSLDANPQNKVHNGADDNASGVAGVLELARYFSTNAKKERNNFLFMCFSGEELGLYGSKHFTDHPSVELAKVDYMINMDMIGRYDAQKGIHVSGSGTSPVWEPLLKKLGAEVPIKTDSSGTGPSDHTSFYLKNIPALHFFTGSHTDYHKPSDDWDKVNFEGEVLVLHTIIKLIESLDSEPKLAFLATKSKTTMGGNRAFKVTLGVMPSYTSDEAGLKVDGVSEGKPAQKAGLLAGDVIIRVGEYPIKDMESYMAMLGKYEKGQTVKVTIKRNGVEKTMDLTF